MKNRDPGLLQHTIGRMALVAAVLGLTAACAGTTRIGTILDDPGRYDGQTVRVEGEVTGSLGIPAVGGAYRIEDGTGTLTVMSEEGGAPREGAEVEVEGTFRSAFTLGDQTAAVLVEDDRYLP